MVGAVGHAGARVCIGSTIETTTGAIRSGGWRSRPAGITECGDWCRRINRHSDHDHHMRQDARTTVPTRRSRSRELERRRQFLA